MPGIARLGDPCGGTIIATAIRTLVNSLPVARLGDQITPHGDSPHDSAVLIEASSTVFAEGIPVCRLGDAASCGHTISGASTDTNAG
jgi:uncharacterized Zn-binding protein involved in type VI secretion